MTANTAECFTKWLKENKTDESGLEEAREAFVALNDSAGQETLDSLLKAQTCTFSYTVEFNMDMDYYNGSLNGKKEVVEVVIDVWNVSKNAIGSTTFTTGSSFNIGGSLGFAANGPSVGLTGSYTVTHQTSQSIPDISVVFTPGADGDSS